MILIGGNGDNVFGRLARILGRSDLVEDPRFATHAARGANQTVLDEIVSDWTREQGLESLLAVLEAEGVPCGRVYTPPDMLSDPQYAARGSIVTVPHPVFGDIRMQDAFPRLSENPGEVRWPGPPLGAHTEEVLRDWAGVTAQAFADLAARGVV